MIRTTIQKIIESDPSLKALATAKVPVKAAYAVSKLIRACNTELEQYNAARMKLFQDAGCVVEKDKWVHKSEPAKVGECIKQSQELAGAEVELNALLLDIDQFQDAQVPGSAFMGLEWALKQEQDI